MENRKHIAIIEENEGMRTMLDRLLRCLGYKVTGYDSPFSFPCIAWDCCISEHRCFDALMVEYRSRTALDGMDFVKHLEKKKCRISKMVVMSASWDNEGLEKSRSLKCNLLPKPFSVKELRDWLEAE